MNKEEIELKPLQLDQLNIEVEGAGLKKLLMNKFGEAIQREFEDKYQLKKAVAKEYGSDVLSEVESKIHRLPDGTVCFPTEGFKRGIEDAAAALSGVTKKQVFRGVAFVDEFVPIKYKKVVINRARVTDSGRTGAPRIRYRPEFHEWSCVLSIEYVRSVISAQAILTLINHAGRYSGLGDWRASKGGDFYGKYQVKENGKKPTKI